MAKSKRPKLAPEEARAVVRRRIREWKKVNAAREKLADREKSLRTDIEGCLVSMRSTEFEASGVKAQLVHTHPIKTKESGNIEFLRGTLSPADFDDLCPRAVNTKLLGKMRPELIEKLAKGSTRKLRLDYTQEPAPAAKSA